MVIIASKVCEVYGEVAPIVRHISHSCNVVDPHSDEWTVYQQCEASCSIIEKTAPFECGPWKRERVLRVIFKKIELGVW